MSELHDPLVRHMNNERKKRDLKWLLKMIVRRIWMLIRLEVF